MEMLQSIYSFIKGLLNDFAWMYTFLPFSIIGGAGTITGPILAATLLVPLQDLVRGWVGSSVQGLAPMIYGIILMLVVYFMPKGLWPTIVKLYKNYTFKKQQKAGKGQVSA